MVQLRRCWNSLYYKNNNGVSIYEGETGIEQTILQVVLRDGQEGVPVQLLQLRRHQVINIFPKLFVKVDFWYLN